MWRGMLSAIVCILPLLLLLDPRSVFEFDWFNHLWMIEYFGEYIRRHGFPPEALATENLMGMVVPIFYAGKFYAFTGVVSSFLGSAITFRTIAFCSLLVQFWHVERATRYAYGKTAVSITVATAVTWAIYPLTNLYNRNALTEFIAVLFLTSAVCCFFVLLLRNSRGEKSYYDAVAMGFFYAIAAVTHPLTAAFGAGFLLCLGTSFLFCEHRSWFASVCLINALLIAGVLSSWLYLLHRFSAWLPASDPLVNQKYFRNIYFDPNSINNLWALFSPTALDLRSLQKGTSVPTPFLDVQMNLPLMVIDLFFIYVWIGSGRCRLQRSQLFLFAAMIASTLLFCLALIIETNPNLSGLFGGIFDVLQFSYRLTTYANLAALTFLLAVGALLSNSKSSPHEIMGTRLAIFIGMVLGLSFSGLETKLVHANTARFLDPFADLVRLAKLHGLPVMPDHCRSWTPGWNRQPSMLGVLPTTFYGHSQYTVFEGYTLYKPVGFEQESRISFLPASGRQFGVVAPVKLTLRSPTFVVTNVQPFPWNQIFVNGHPRKSEDLVALAFNWGHAKGPAGVLALPLEAGEYTIEYRFRPTKTWQILEALSFGILVIWFLLWIVTALRRGRGAQL